ncbi:Oye2p [Sugiyamaella lignohabitans]|uniref:Oye2p n=1 Tax=Sugiyamaella lignohabitans TaxID=796027 RepID=A0A167CCB5_9ASCO|nr:Oye2p [Sugiyamaella lignohabitans]ANB11500.1 Oye2p [Sugiyamaella lignohabitans]
MTVSGDATPLLYTPLKVGRYELQHRVVLAPLTRFRSPNHVPTDSVAEYYAQRASRPGTLLITEGTYIAAKAGGYPHVPGIWSEEQVKAWKKVVDRVNVHNSYLFVQLWALGRAAEPKVLESEGLKDQYVSASNVAMADKIAPRALTKDEIKEYVQHYVQAAKNSIAAGAAGVEIHNANG